MNRIRVLEIISGFAVEGPLGGIERFGIELAQSLNQEIIEPIVCGLWAYGTPYEYNWVNMLNKQGVKAFIAADWEASSPYKSFVRAYKGTKKQMEPPIDIIHSHCQFGDILALLLKRQVGARALIRTVHNEREWSKRPLRRTLLTGLLFPLLFDYEFGVAQQVVDNLDQRLVARLIRKRSVRAYNALNLARFENIKVDRSAKKRQLGIPENIPIIGTVGRLTEQKGYDVLLKAAAIVLKKIPHVYFLFIGGGELYGELKKQATNLGIEDHVLFTGPRDDVEELFQIMDIFVNSSLWEGLPTVMLESMAAQVPIIATKVSGNIELIQHKKTGLLIPPADFEQLGQTIIASLTTPPEVVQEMCLQANDFVRKHFSIQMVAQQYATVYSNLISDNL